MSRLRVVLTMTLTLAALALPAAAQKKDKVPRRPKLGAGADTNDANAYYQFGVAQLDRNPGAAADALYWATHIEPGWADAFYVRRVALMLDDPDRLARYIEGDRKVIQSAEMQRIDSLELRAVALNPFIFRRFDRQLLTTYIERSVERAAGGRSNVDRGALSYEIQNFLNGAGPAIRAWMAYSDGRFPAALASYADVLKEQQRLESRDAYLTRVERGRIFVLLGSLDSALAELTAGVESARQLDKKDLVMIYDSKAVLEESIGMVHEAAGHRDPAREAYARALEEDLSYYPAHVRLAQLALRGGDTTTALNEYDLAVQLRGDDADLRYQYGYALVAAGKDSAAAEQLGKAAEIEPYWAQPHRILGLIADAHSQAPAAIQHYQRFLALAAKRDTNYQWTAQRIQIIQSAAPQATGSAP